jgi:hypothetical protein
MLPDSGLRQSDQRVKLNYQGEDQDQFYPILSPPVGSFVDDLNGTVPTKLAYRVSGASETLRTGRAVFITITFRPRMVIRNRESVTLTLARFTGQSSSSLSFTRSGGNSVPPWNASWDSTRQRLHMVYIDASRPILADTPMSLTLDPWISIASDGVDENDPSLFIESDAVDGPVLPTPIVISQRVEGVILSSSIHFTRAACDYNGFQWICTNTLAKAGERCEVQVSFSFAVPMAIGDTLRVRLPGFTGSSIYAFPAIESSIPVQMNAPTAFAEHPYGCKSNLECQNVYNYKPSGSLSTASWVLETSTLEFTVAKAIQARTTVSVLIPVAAGVTLPGSGLRGVKANDTAIASNGDLTLASWERAEQMFSVPPSPFRVVTPVGYFSYFRVLFTQKLSGFPTGVTLRFSAVMDLRPADTITLVLPTFRGVQQEIIPTSDPPGIFSSLAFRSESLILRVARFPVLSGTDVRVDIPSSFGITTPLQGVPADFPDIVVSSTAQAGPVPPTTVSASEAIPAILTGTSLSYDRTDGFRPLSMNISFTAGKTLSKDTFIEVNLPGFTGSDSSAIPVRFYIVSSRRALALANYIELASWSQATRVLRLAITSAVPAQTRALVSVPSSAGLTLSANGLAQDSSSLSIRYFTPSEESAPASRIEASPSVTALLADTKVTFAEGAQAGKPTAVNLTLTPTFPEGFGTGDTLVLSLPGFKLDSNSSGLLVTSVPAGKVKATAWSYSNGIGRLSMQFLDLVFSPIIIAIAQETGLTVPETGVRQNTPDIKVSAQIFGVGTISETPLLSVQPVGALMGSPHMVFEPPRASTVSQISIEISAYMPLGPGDVIAFSLPGFAGPSGPIETQSLPSPMYMPRASWTHTTSTLAMTFGSPTPIPPGTKMTVVIPSTAGLRLPADGIALSDTCLGALHTECPMSYQVFTQFGRVMPTPVYSYLPIGVFSESALTCTPRVAGRPTQLTLEFSYVRPLSPGDALVLTLNGFGYPGAGFGQARLLPGSIFDQVNILRTNSLQLVMESVRSAPAGARQRVTIPMSAGILVPPRGLDYNNPLMFIQMTAAAGDALLTPLLHPPSIGAFINPELSVDPLTSGSIAEIVLTFTPTMVIEPGEHVIITLTGYLGQAASMPDVTTTQVSDDGENRRIGNVSYFTWGTWNLENRTFIMSPNMAVDPNQRLQVTIPRSAAIRLPASGLGGFKYPSTIESDARAGIVDPTAIFSRSNVSAVLSQTSLDIVTREAGAASELHLTFLSMLRLEVGATIRFILPNFFGGKQCWEASLGTPEFDQRCLTVPNPTDRQARYCTDVDPTINAFQRRMEGGCFIKPGIVILPEPALMDNSGSCACINTPEHTEAARAAYARKHRNATLPPNYGKNCSAWDSIDGKCELILDSVGPWCCASWCFVDPLCASAIPWEVSPDFAISFTTCNASSQASQQQTCPYANYSASGDRNLANASWIESRSQLVITLRKSIQV